MVSSVFLFGAGASIDAGLADAFKLTENIYTRLLQERNEEARKVFGLVVAKVIARRVRGGGSPFEKVNVEEVYDGIQRLANRNSDILSEFVSGWDPAIASMRMNISVKEVESAFETLLSSYRTDGFSGRKRFAFGSRGAEAVKELLSRAFDPALDGKIGEVETALQRVLVESLQHNADKIAYFQNIIEVAKDNGADIVTLNYDLIAEKSAEAIGLTYDYGLSKWNREKVVQFPRSSAKNIRVLKLHGSLNWFSKGDDIEVKEDEKNSRRWGSIPSMVFGGSGNKLRIDGPFLQLRHEFQTRVLAVSTLVIVGYSFQDEHLNSIIRRWTATRRRAKLIVVNPSPVSSFAGAIGIPYKMGKNGKNTS